MADENSGSFGDHVPGFNIPGYSSFTEGDSEGYTWTPEKFLIVSPYLSDMAILTAGSEIASLPVSNLQDQEPSKVWRTDGSLNQYVNLVSPKPVAFNCLAFGWPSGALSSSAIVRVKLYTSLANMNADLPVFDTLWKSVWPSGYKHEEDNWGPEVGLLRWNNESAYSHATVLFKDLANPLAYIDISRIALSRAIHFVINPKHEGGISYVPLDVQEPNGYGQIFTDPRPYQQRRFDLMWSAMGDKAIKEDIMTLSRLRGQAGDVFVYLDPAAITDFHLTSMQAIFEGSHKFTPTPIHVPDKDGQFRKSWSFSLSMLQKL